MFIGDFRAEGYLASAMVNYLALLGWSPGDDREILTLAEMVEAFGLDDVVSSPAFFDVAKLRHVNGEHIRALTVRQFVDLAAAFVPDTWDLSRLGERLLGEVRDRMVVLADVEPYVSWFFVDDETLVMDDASWTKQIAKDAASAAIVLEAAIGLYAVCEWNADVLHEATGVLAEQLEYKLNRFQAPIRVAVTGRSVGPPLFESLAILGRDATLARLRRAQSNLS